MKTVLTIAGSDCSGGAGIQADIKTITANKLYASSVITALTAQNTTGVSGIFEVSPEFVAQQLDSVFTDIAPDAVKVGMVSSSDIIKVIASQLTRYNAKNIVVDPVMVATSGSRLIGESAIETLISALIPLARVITPNIPESEVLCGFSIHNEDDMVKAARAIADKTGWPFWSREAIWSTTRWTACVKTAISSGMPPGASTTPTRTAPAAPSRRPSPVALRGV